MHASKLPLLVWFCAAHLMATHSNGISARQLQAQLGLGCYKSARLLCAKLRRAMVDPDRNPLTGLVEIDETTLPNRILDDPPAGGIGRSHIGKMPVLGAVEVIDDGPGRLRLSSIADYSAASIHTFVAKNSRLRGHHQRRRLGGLSGHAPGVPRSPHHRKHGRPLVVLPWIHRVFSNLKK